MFSGVEYYCLAYCSVADSGLAHVIYTGRTGALGRKSTNDCIRFCISGMELGNRHLESLRRLSSPVNYAKRFRRCFNVKNVGGRDYEFDQNVNTFVAK